MVRGEVCVGGRGEVERVESGSEIPRLIRQRYGRSATRALQALILPYRVSGISV